MEENSSYSHSHQIGFSIIVEAIGKADNGRNWE